MKKIFAGAILAGSLSLGACSSPPVEQLDQVLNDTFEAEQEYDNVQAELERLEQQEQELFESIMGLTQEQQEEVEAQAAEALDSARRRLELLETETEAMTEARETFSGIEEVVDETEDEAIRANLVSLKEKMEERYEAHAEFAAAYEELAQRQIALYEMLADPETDLLELQEQTAAVNEQNTVVQEAVNRFNELTEQFNSLKNEVTRELEG